MIVRYRVLAAALLAVAALRCSGRPASDSQSTPPEAEPAPETEEADELPEPPPQPPSRAELTSPVWVVDSPGQGHWAEATEAQSQGLTIIDLSESWTPTLFEVHHSEGGGPLPNRYRRVFLGLARDELDGDGEPLEPNEKNYLELYGIFPNLSVLRRRMLEDAEKPCITDESRAALLAVKSVPFRSDRKAVADDRRLASLTETLERRRRSAKVASLQELATKAPDVRADVEEHARLTNWRAAFRAAEERLRCEGFLAAASGRAGSRNEHRAGQYDEPMQNALRDFQLKHMIYEGHTLQSQTLAALARSTLDNDHLSLLRALRERVVAATGVLEDGSVTAPDSSGQPVRNLAEEYTQAAAEQLGLTDATASLRFLGDRPEEDLDTLMVGVKLAPLPAYYADHMELSIEVDRGDVWYDPPFDAKDRWKILPRNRYPTMTLRLTHEGKTFPLVRWRTTIGGWRSEQAANGYEYYKYKASDVGPRVMRHIISGPVWVAPESTPLRSLVKSKAVNGRWQSLVNYDELGPGYLSAYGVVAGYLVIPGQGDDPDVDRGIRLHGSSNYLSIYSANGYSHGCHRLPNHLAVRLYDFLLKHRRHVVKGDAPMDFWRQWLWQDTVYEMRIPSRGYVFQMDPPLEVNVLEGNVRGKLKEPIEGYVDKPGVRYPPPDSPDALGKQPGKDGDADAMTGPTWRKDP